MAAQRNPNRKKPYIISLRPTVRLQLERIAHREKLSIAEATARAIVAYAQTHNLGV